MGGSTIVTATSISPDPSFTSIATVFDIHFLQSRICAHLDSRSLRRCALVSRDFYVAFNPFLWKSIRIRTRATYKRFIQPEALAALVRFASIVTEVTSVFPSVWVFFLLHPCPNLILLDSPSLQNHIQCYRNTNYISTLLELLRKSLRLQTLRLGYFLYTTEAVDTFFQTVRQHPTLKNLDIDHQDHVSCILVRNMLWNTINLERVSFNLTVMNYRQRFITEEEQQSLLRLTGQDDPAFELRELSLPGRFYDHEEDTLFLFLKRCPKIERLVLPGMYWPRQVPALADIIASTLPRLQHLDFSSSPIPGPFVAKVVQSCRNLRTFIGHDNHDEPLPLLLAVSQHWRTLRIFRMHAGDALPSTGILRLLTTCSELEILDLMRLDSRWMSCKEQRKARENNWSTRRTGDAYLDVTGMDEVHGRPSTPWVCDRLKVLRINFGMITLDGGNDEILPRVLYEQLGALSMLEDLRLGWIQPPPPPVDDDSEAEDLATSDHVVLGKVLRSVKEQQSQQQARVQNIGAALQEFTKLTCLRKLELRGLTSFIEKEQLRRLRSKWEDIEWIHHT